MKEPLIPTTRGPRSNWALPEEVQRRSERNFGIITTLGMISIIGLAAYLIVSKL